MLSVVLILLRIGVFMVVPTTSTPLDVHLVTLGYMTPANTFASNAYIGPAIDYAVKNMNHPMKYAQTLRVDNTYLTDSNYSSCAALGLHADDIVGRWYYNLNRTKDAVYVLIAPACLEDSTVNYMAANWDLLLISTVSASYKIRDRERNPTWISTAYVSSSQYGEFYDQLLAQYHWTSVVILVDVAGLPSQLSLAYSVQRIIEQTPGRLVVRQNVSSRRGIDFERELMEFSWRSRIMLVFMHPVYLRQLLIQASRLNMTNGDYVYVAVEIFQNRLFGNTSWQYYDGNDAVAREAFRSLLVFQPAHSSDGLPHVLDELLPLARNLSIKFHRRSREVYNYNYPLSDQPFSSIAASYSAVAAVCQILDQLVFFNYPEDGFDVTSGKALAIQFINQSFIDETNIPFYIDGKGERRMDLMVTFLNASGQREAFLYMTAENGTLIELRDPSWPRSWPPPNVPECGYRNENVINPNCLPPVDKRWIYGTVFGTITGVLILGWIILRRIRRIKEKEEELKLFDPWWQINSELIRPLAVPGTSQSQQPKTLNTKFKIPAVAVYDDRAVQLNSIAISNRYIYTSEITTHRHLLLLFKRLRKVQHTGICRFIGLTILENNFEQHITVIAEYASKASLYEVFDSYGELDLGVRSTFARDYLDALEYIHNSSIMYHGRLSTFRLHVDKFFSVKIIHLAYERIQRGLDPRYFKMRKYDCDEWEPAYWAAPEFFTSNIVSGRKRDIYSTGFILFEIITQERLYKRLLYLDPSDLDFGEHNPLQQTANFNLLPKPFKPMVPALQSCWNANPDLRPSIAQLKSYFNEFSAGPSGARKIAGEQVMDKLIQRLQDYTEELQNDINQKALQLEQQVEKYYEILSYKLPAYIVTRIRAGENPLKDAERMDSVSVLLTSMEGLGAFIEQNSPADTTVVINDVEAILEDLISKFHVSRIATLSDYNAFVSGMSPTTNALDNAREICAFALTVQSTVRETFAAKQIPVFLKMAINTGSCTIVITGKGMKLQYRLLGNVLRVGLVLCTHCLFDKIHISKPTAMLIADCPEFATELRQPPITRHTDLATFWLYSTDISILAEIIDETLAEADGPPGAVAVEIHHPPGDSGEPAFVPHPLPPDD
ncbi:atrial natriuretic peptide receptor 1-like [Paramacrobiotus metropolitanus]|uniref:atrial natriuretic peptide receptor 1-like n=1 Tax=Paramacrobiotus metropolitanus TaxID=2943436 RepID=UPI00244594C8|nr:atrial natriuretic peptide receptor 1-like [Paramacrobiotus metropolitanus]